MTTHEVGVLVERLRALEAGLGQRLLRIEEKLDKAQERVSDLERAQEFRAGAESVKRASRMALIGVSGTIGTVATVLIQHYLH